MKDFIEMERKTCGYCGAMNDLTIGVISWFCCKCGKRNTDIEKPIDSPMAYQKNGRKDAPFGARRSHRKGHGWKANHQY